MSTAIEVHELAADEVTLNGRRVAELGARFVIDSAIACQGAVEMIVTLEDAAKAVKKKRDWILEPLQEVVKRTKATAEETIEPLVLIANRLREGIKNWQREEQRKADEARAAEDRRQREEAARVEAERQRLAEEALALQDRETLRALDEGRAPEEIAPEPTPEALPVVRVHVPEAPRVFESTRGQAVMKKRWAYEVTAVDLLPDQYVTKEPNRGLLKLAVASGVREIPGVRIFQEDDLSIGKRR